MATTSLWSSSSTQNGYVLLKGQVKTALITGVKEASYDGTAISHSDATTYRDTTDAAYAGGPAGTSSGTTPVSITANNNIISQGDEYTHTAPRDHVKKVTMLYLWSGTKDSSNVLFSCPLHLYQGFSTADYSFIS